jgi:5-methyltetrahydrofolate--homocysteine methyltransferase
MGVSAVGINCSLGPDQLVAIVKGIKNVVSIPVVVKPNAGVPFINDKGEAEYSMGPVEFAQHMKVLVEAGADLIGGCCGTTPAYITGVAKAAARWRPKKFDIAKTKE